ncbi:hypothetical protein XI05_04835 [Bradyrhizobium sp. CCBAU 11357]|nr:hypothetical protein [Bradyrhizobium sp. CCBAU 11357]
MRLDRATTEVRSLSRLRYGIHTSKLKTGRMSDSVLFSLSRRMAWSLDWDGLATVAWKKGGLSAGPAGGVGRPKAAGASIGRQSGGRDSPDPAFA